MPLSPKSYPCIDAKVILRTKSDVFAQFYVCNSTQAASLNVYYANMLNQALFTYPHQWTKEPTGSLNMATPWQFMVTHSQAYWVNSYICDERLSAFLWKSVTYCVSQVPSTSWKQHVFPGNCTPFIGTVFQSLEIQLPEFVSILSPQTKL